MRNWTQLLEAGGPGSAEIKQLQGRNASSSLKNKILLNQLLMNREKGISYNCAISSHVLAWLWSPATNCNKFLPLYISTSSLDPPLAFML